MSGKEIFMDSKGHFAQGIHRFVSVFAEEAGVILKKVTSRSQCIDSIFQCSRASSINCLVEASRLEM